MRIGSVRGSFLCGGWRCSGSRGAISTRAPATREQRGRAVLADDGEHHGGDQKSERRAPVVARLRGPGDGAAAG